MGTIKDRNGTDLTEAEDIFKNLFNWRLITLQYCSGLCHTLTWISHGCTCVPLPEPPSHLPPHPIPQGQCTSPEHPVSCIEPGLVIYYTHDNIHDSMLFSQIIPPSLSPRVQKSVLYICVSFAVLHIGSLLPSFQIPYICVNILYWCFSFWLTSFCIIGSSFIYLIRTDSNAFFLFHCICTTAYLSICRY